MPNRIIKESICTSEEIDGLTAFQETFFYRLIVNCDDFGRLDAREKILKSKLFPLKDVREDNIKAALLALSSAELVILYEVDGKPFLQMRTWDKHQQVRAKKSKYPAPPQRVPSNDSKVSAEDNTCNQMISDDSKCPRNPIQSESVSESNPNPMRETHARAKEDDGFETFWNAYPRKSGDTREAYMAWLRALKNGATLEAVLSALSWQTEEWKREGQPQYIPSPTKWLDNRRWTETPRTGKQVTTFMDV